MAWPTASKALVSEAAAITVIDPWRPDSLASVVLLLLAESSSPPHAATIPARPIKHTTAAAVRKARNLIVALVPPLVVTVTLLERVSGSGRGRLDGVKRRPTLSLNEWAVLGLLVERPRHGYDIAAELRVDAEVGQVWRVTRPVVYRAFERLDALDLVEAGPTEPSTEGPPRTVFAATAAGRRQLRHWLQQPVDHVRDMRSGFLLKLVLARRLGVDPDELVRAQLAQLDEQLAALGTPPPADEVVALWRHHSALATRAFLEALAPSGVPSARQSSRS
jgi:DNA-binding PadR family transcriptional regulator